MKNPITKLRIIQLQNLKKELETFSDPKTYHEETLLVKYFEMSFELIIKTLSSLYLHEVNFPLIPKKDLIRWAFDYNLIKNPEIWMEINELRNETVHDYLADEIFSHLSKIKSFLPEIFFFIDNLLFFYER